MEHGLKLMSIEPDLMRQLIMNVVQLQFTDLKNPDRGMNGDLNQSNQSILYGLNSQQFDTDKNKEEQYGPIVDSKYIPHPIRYFNIDPKNPPKDID